MDCVAIYPTLPRLTPPLVGPMTSDNVKYGYMQGIKSRYPCFVAFDIVTELAVFIFLGGRKDRCRYWRRRHYWSGIASDRSNQVDHLVYCPYNQYNCQSEKYFRCTSSVGVKELYTKVGFASDARRHVSRVPLHAKS